MSIEEQDQRIGRAHRQLKEAKAALEQLERIAKEMGGRLVAIAHALQGQSAGTIVKEGKNISVRSGGGVIIGPGPYPSEDDILGTTTEISRLKAEIKRLEEILA